jgi:hypothetical protein
MKVVTDDTDHGGGGGISHVIPSGNPHYRHFSHPTGLMNTILFLGCPLPFACPSGLTDTAVAVSVGVGDVELFQLGNQDYGELFYSNKSGERD